MSIRLTARLAAILIWACAWSLGVAPGAGARTSDLLLYLTFDSMQVAGKARPGDTSQVWRVHDYSPRRADTYFYATGDSFSSVNGPHRRALRSTTHSSGSAEGDWGSMAPTDGVSVLAWVRVEGPGRAYPIYLNDSQGTNILRLAVTSWGTYWWGGQANGDEAFLVEAPRIRPGVWVHYAAIYDGTAGAASIYVDGVKEAKAVPSGALSEAWDTRDLGAIQVEFIPEVAGTGIDIDDLSVWGRALTRSDVHDIMVNGAPLSVSPMDAVTTTWGALRQR
jgi:hypothetical protein